MCRKKKDKLLVKLKPSKDNKISMKLMNKMNGYLFQLNHKERFHHLRVKMMTKKDGLRQKIMRKKWLKLYLILRKKRNKCKDLIFGLLVLISLYKM